MTVDLRSDTVTKPTTQMRAYMMQAEVGDDVFGEDPSILALEDKISTLFVTEASMFCPTATMANQIAIKILTSPLDEIICDRTAHVYNYEVGGYAFHSGCGVRYVHGERGVFSAADVENNINPDDVHKTITSLVCVENTVNRGGGKIFPLETIRDIDGVCKTRGMKLHMDGSRIFNALVATGDDAGEFGKTCDTISICLSKGLGCPVGALLTGRKEYLDKARRVRKVFGGGLRQAGILAAAGLYALEHHVDRMKDDHRMATELAGMLKECNYVDTILSPETNIVIFRLRDDVDDDGFIDYLGSKGVKAFTIGDNFIRFVTHLDITPDMIHDVVGPALRGFTS